ncbi:hypothetical protein J1N35_040147 [Gossypium stocksii]|uniref:Uncharacterized protein n=1 Tax=Gossypium stocksii TaxID=47602 RepID=A0A9D3UD04_9ROSI|nr:hypothetical protein J1N35_040147 [Gossypium stocksii]
MEKVPEPAVEMGTKKLFGMLFMLLLLVALASRSICDDIDVVLQRWRAGYANRRAIDLRECA